MVNAGVQANSELVEDLRNGGTCAGVQGQLGKQELSTNFFWQLIAKVIAKAVRI